MTVSDSDTTYNVVFPTLLIHKDAAYLVSVSVTDLSDEEMEITLYASYFDHIWSHSHLYGLSPCGPYCPASLTLPRRAPIGEAFRSLGRNFSAEGSRCSTCLTRPIRTPSGKPTGTKRDIFQQDTMHLARPFLPG